MTRERLKLGAALVVTAVAAATFSVTLYRAVIAPASDEAPFSAARAPLATSTDLLPARLVIPSIGVDAGVQRVGLTAAGNMATPHGFSDAAWYKYGTVPGNVGTAVMDGHVDNGLSLPGVFKRLGEVRRGDEVDVVDTAGDTLRFTVDRAEAYPYQAVPMAAIMSRSNAAHLALITCEGSWVGAERTYDHRLVVFATLRGYNNPK